MPPVPASTLNASVFNLNASVFNATQLGSAYAQQSVSAHYSAEFGSCAILNVNSFL